VNVHDIRLELADGDFWTVVDSKSDAEPTPSVKASTPGFNICLTGNGQHLVSGALQRLYVKVDQCVLAAGLSSGIV
jgi:hypothetical protein